VEASPGSQTPTPMAIGFFSGPCFLGLCSSRRPVGQYAAPQYGFSMREVCATCTDQDLAPARSQRITQECEKEGRIRRICMLTDAFSVRLFRFVSSLIPLQPICFDRKGAQQRAEFGQPPTVFSFQAESIIKASSLGHGGARLEEIPGGATRSGVIRTSRGGPLVDPCDS